MESRLEKYDDAALKKDILSLRRQLRQQDIGLELLARSFATIREVSGRTIGMRHFDVQLMGGWVLLQGGLAEMETGEGKTLTATLAAATAALAGAPVHIITVNDYLVRRDAQLMGPVYNALGLTVGMITEEMEPPARRKAYSCDITYCTNKQVAFDYLRDRLVLGNDVGRMRLELEQLHHDSPRLEQLYLHGLCYAIIDEADSVLADEAGTPLILSRLLDSPDEEQLYREAMDLAEKLRATGAFTIDKPLQRIEINEKGRKLLADLGASMGPEWQGEKRREELVSQALAALCLYRRDHEYLVHEEKVILIDTNTGRTMADRSWSNGLQQMVEIKERCALTEKREPLARITYQRFFRRYMRLAGMTGTAREIRSEFWDVYRLHVHIIPTHRPCQREFYGRRIYPDKEKKWAAVVKSIRHIQQRYRPVLVGTCSVADSEYLSLLLTENGIDHQVLNARQNTKEAEVIARAGELGQITIATNMAGRGTDIPLGHGTAQKGGLHVIISELNDAGRIDRQLSGRCARQGEPGSYEFILSMEDALIGHIFSEGWLRKKMVSFLQKGSPPARRIGLTLLSWSQRAREKNHQQLRRNLMNLDKQLGKTLSFSGRME